MGGSKKEILEVMRGFALTAHPWKKALLGLIILLPNALLLGTLFSFFIPFLSDKHHHQSSSESRNWITISTLSLPYSFPIQILSFSCLIILPYCTSTYFFQLLHLRLPERPSGNICLIRTLSAYYPSLVSYCLEVHILSHMTHLPVIMIFCHGLLTWRLCGGHTCSLLAPGFHNTLSSAENISFSPSSPQSLS